MVACEGPIETKTSVGTGYCIGCGWASDARSVVRRAHGGLFDELVFGVVIGIHRACLRPQRWGLMCNLSVNRLGVFKDLRYRKSFNGSGLRKRIV